MNIKITIRDNLFILRDHDSGIIPNLNMYAENHHHFQLMYV